MYVYVYICIYMYILFIHSSASGHLSCFYFLAMVNHAAVNMSVGFDFFLT